MALSATLLAAWLSLELLPYLRDDEKQTRTTQKLLKLAEQGVTRPCPMLVIRGAGDLATSMLAFAVAASRFSNWCLRYVYDRVRPALIYPVIAICSFSAVMMVSGLLRSAQAAIILLAPFQVLMIAYVVFLAPWYLLRAFAGTELLHPRFACEIDISETPADVPNVERHTLNNPEHLNSLRHNAYDNPGAALLISKWIVRSLRPTV